MMYPLVRELAADGVPAAVTCRLLKLARQPYHRWLAKPVGHAELVRAYRADALFDAHRDDPEFGYRFLADEAREAGQVDGRPDRFGSSARSSDGSRRSARSAAATANDRAAGPRRPVRRERRLRPRPSRLHRGLAEPAVARRHHRAPHR